MLCGWPADLGEDLFHQLVHCHWCDPALQPLPDCCREAGVWTCLTPNQLITSLSIVEICKPSMVATEGSIALQKVRKVFSWTDLASDFHLPCLRCCRSSPALTGSLLLLLLLLQAWGQQCGDLDQYGMKYTRLFANLCNAQVEPHHLTGVLNSICAAK